MFYDSNTTHFSLHVEGQSQSQEDSSNQGLLGQLQSSSVSSFIEQASSMAISALSSKSQPKTAVDHLQVLNFKGYEGISTPYAYEVTLINKHVRFDVTKLLSQRVFLAFTPEGTSGKGIHGEVQSVKRCSVGEHYATFSIIITPRLTNLKRRTNQRCFVGKTVPDIIKTILEEHQILEGSDTGFQYKLKETYPVRDFCVQYDENDYHFIARLAEEEGISYFFTHQATGHQITFCDAMPFFPSISEAVQYMNDTGMVADTPVLKYFDVALATKTDNASWRDYNFKTAKRPEGNSQGKQSEKANNAVEPKLEHYDYPSSGMDEARNKHLAKVQIERLRANHLIGEGYSDRNDLHAGHYITIEGHPSLDTMDAEKPWLITDIKYQAFQPQVLEAFGASNAAQSNMPSQLHKYIDRYTELEFPVGNIEQGVYNVFNAIPQEVPYRPRLNHPKPQVLGSQTAIVTGPAGEEIYCDEYGRVKVQFHWDREGQMNENSSHWIRVASSWAHDGYGAVVIPRVGMEVMVDFLEGNPDDPIIKGALHNGVNKVPYDLPANKTRSVFKTSSSKGGVGSNELRIEDKAGAEQIFVQSQRNFDQLTKNNHTVQVKNNSHLQVGNEHSETITGNRYQHQKAEENHLVDLDRKTQVMMNDHKTVGISEHTTIGTVQTIQAGQEVHLKAGMQIVVDGGLSLTLKAGGHHIVLNPAGIWMTIPVLPIGVPMIGTPAMPLPPMNKAKVVETTVSPPTQLAALKQGKVKTSLCPATQTKPQA